MKRETLTLLTFHTPKLIESIRQQNINEKGSYDDALKTIRAEYDQFRQAYNLEYPPQFLPPSERPKVKTEVQFDRAEIGMYNMNLHGYYKKQLSATRNQLYKYLSAYNEIVALACQGRIEEIEDIYSNELNAETYHGSFNQLMKQKKKQIMSMAKTAKKVDESKMTDLRNGESVGEYFDRKILKRSSFMELYNEMNDFDMAKYYEGEIKNNENITAANKRSKKSGGTVDIEDL